MNTGESGVDGAIARLRVDRLKSAYPLSATELAAR